MKKLMKSMLTLVALFIVVAANAETKEVTFDFAGNSWDKTVVSTAAEKKVEANAFGSETIDGVTLNTLMGSAIYYPALRSMYDASSETYSDPYLDLVKNNKLTLEVAEGNIASITFNVTNSISSTRFVAGDWTSAITNSDTAEKITLNNPASSIELILSTTAYIKSMIVTITTEGGDNPGTGPGTDPGTGSGPELTDEEKALDDNTVIDLSKRLIVARLTYGDAMGETGRNTCTGQKNYYYNKDLKLANITNNKAEMEGLTFVTTDYVYYNYNDNGQIVSERGYQIGTYDYGEKEAKESRADHADYVYNDKGQLVSMTNSEGTTTYEYNEAGQLFQEITSTGKTLQYTYNENGNVASVENIVTDEYAFTRPSEAYKEKYTYSEAGRKIKVERVYARDVEYKYFGSITKWYYADQPISSETWKYENGYLTENYKYVYNNNFDKIPASRFIYNYSEDKNTVTYIKETYNEQKDTWYLQPTTTVDQYKDYSLVPAELYASEIVSAKQSTDPKDGLNCAEVEFTLPKLIMTDPTLDIVVYRDGIRVQTVNPAMWDLVPEYNLSYNEQTGNLIYKDKHLKNGTHEYFFQTVPSVKSNSGMDPLADEEIDGGGMVTPVDHEESFIVSNRATAEIFTKLPVATNLRASGNASGAGEITVSVDFEYDDAIKSEYEFKRSILVANGSLFVDDENPSVKTSNPSVKRLSDAYDAGATVSLTIVTQYALGTVTSEPLVINTSDVITSVEAVSSEMMNGKTMMFDLQGRQVTAPAKGVFIMVKNGKATKVTVK